MKSINLLDCTLRDGGYVNDWMYGREAIEKIVAGLEEAAVEILEIGFLRKGQSNPNRSSYPTILELNASFGKKREGVIYSAMIEGAASFPLDDILPATDSGVDLIRICTWKRLTDEHFDYCKKVGEKGYKISLQPTAVSQYNEQEFTEMVKKANDVHPFALYIVDTWGTQDSENIRKYAEIAGKYLDEDIMIGYHGHNNKMQALSCAQSLLNMNLPHAICIDSSISGMGRGVGNLQTEVIMDYLNKNHGKHYDSMKMVDLYEKYLFPIYQEQPWGYSPYFYISAKYGCAQDFATYFRDNMIGEYNFKVFLDSLTAQEMVVFRKDFVEERLNELNILY